MEKNKCGNGYSPEVRERAVRMVFEYPGEFDSQSDAIKSIAPRLAVDLIGFGRGSGVLKRTVVDAMV